MCDDPSSIEVSFLQKPQRHFAKFKNDTGGATASIFAVILPVLIGFGALAIDVGVWSINSRRAQGAADQAAYSAAVASGAGSDAVTEARAIAASMGFIHQTGGVTVQVDNPPATGAFAGSTSHWQVTVRQPQSLGLAALFTVGAPTVVARAVAGSGAGSSCVIGLNNDPTVNAVVFNNGTTLQQLGCGIYSNSSISIGNGTQTVISAALYAAGAITQGNTSQVTGSKSEDQPIFVDPYLGVSGVTPTTLPCIPVVSGSGNLTPGRYCDGFDLGNNSNINLAAGVYYINSRFKVGNNNRFTGTGVTLIFDLPATSNVSVGTNNTFNIVAPVSGPFSGIAFMNTTAPTPSSFTFGNNNIVSVQGAFYFPNSTLNMNNNLDVNRCTQLVALNVSLSNNATMKSSCPGSGIEGINGGSIALVE